MECVFFVVVEDCFYWVKMILCLLQKASIHFWILIQCASVHENSTTLKECIHKWKELAMRLQLHQTTYERDQNLMDDQQQKWRAVSEATVEWMTFCF